ncbi:GNAT family N-acetyltransferase [Clostridium sp. P21]|uniref:GNAT family N-acetyltransferase n=1 Tax=Clostridium muellerianum TaxID=2716538 RepID=A0A7Y0HPY7_9CLOT|nr:GNAT family N-acetyltransferase [Clostridium muellerianum]NMM63183.1 GNAT family N-acetyltransferase [Clostridium muellerianum]
MNFIVRPVELKDARDINEIRTMDGVKENILGIISERVSKSETFINNLTKYDHILVAETNENSTKKVIGVVGLNVNCNPRTKHSASMGIMVHKDYQGKGIGKSLMKKILDLSDNWLMLVRVELGVFTDNEKAINLYKSFGFKIEGTRKYAAARNGKYADEYIMARYKNI